MLHAPSRLFSPAKFAGRPRSPFRVNLGTVPRHALTHAPATREALVTEIRLFERMSRRGYRIAIAPGMLFIIAGATIEAAKKGRPLWPALIMIALMAGMGIVIHMRSQTEGKASILR